MRSRGILWLVLLLIAVLCGCNHTPVSSEEALMVELIDSANVRFDAENYGLALEEALSAYDLAKKLEDAHHLSRVEFLIARIYQQGYDDFEAYKWDLMSLNHAKQIGCDNDSLAKSYVYIGYDLLRMNWTRKAMEYADSALALSALPRPQAEEIKCLSYLVRHETVKADSIRKILDSMEFQSPYIAEMLQYYTQYTKDELIEFQKSVIKEKTDYINKISSRQLSETRQKYEREKADRLSASLKAKQKETIIITVIGFLIVLSLVLLIVLIRLRAKSLRIEKENQIHTLTVEYENLFRDNQETVTSNIALKKEVSAAFRKQFSWLEKLCAMYNKANKSPRERERILYETVNREIELLASKNNFLKQIQELMAEHNPDLLRQIDELNLIRSEREIVMYSVCGLSPALMAVLSNKSLRAVYNLKVRIKEKLTRLDTPFSRQILELL